MTEHVHKNGMPWMNKGRWYKFFIETTENGYKITTSDLEGSKMSATTLELPIGYRIMDYVLDIHNTTDAVATFSKQFKLYADGSSGVSIPNVTAFDYCTVYVFAYLER